MYAKQTYWILGVFQPPSGEWDWPGRGGLVMQRQGSLALAVMDARLHEASVDLAAKRSRESRRWPPLPVVDALRPLFLVW